MAEPEIKMPFFSWRLRGSDFSSLAREQGMICGELAELETTGEVGSLPGKQGRAATVQSHPNSAAHFACLFYTSHAVQKDPSPITDCFLTWLVKHPLPACFTVPAPHPRMAIRASRSIQDLHQARHRGQDLTFPCYRESCSPQIWYKLQHQ